MAHQIPDAGGFKDPCKSASVHVIWEVCGGYFDDMEGFLKSSHSF